MANFTNLQGWTSADTSSTTKTITLDFTPTAGSLLVMFGVAAATFTTPTGWMSGPSIVGDFAMVVLTKVADGTETSISWTQNGPRGVAAAVYEFPAGTTFEAGSWNDVIGGAASDTGSVAFAPSRGTLIRCNVVSAPTPYPQNRLVPTGDLVEDYEAAANPASFEDAWIWCGHKDFSVPGSATVGWTAPSGAVTSYYAINAQLAVPAAVAPGEVVGQFFPGGGSGSGGGGGGGSAGHVVQDEGTDLEARANLNFVGEGVVATDDAANDATVVTVAGGGTGLPTPAAADHFLITRAGAPVSVTTRTWASNGYNGLVNYCRANTITMTATASGTLGSDVPPYVLDESISTYWHSNNAAGNWWRVDFGADYRITPTYIGIEARVFGGDPRMYNYAFEGSTDDTNWVRLHTVVNTILGSGLWFSIPVTTTEKFQYFRVLSTGLDSFGNNYQVFSSFEVWGTLYNLNTGTTWQQEPFVGGSGGSGIKYQTAPPTSPATGDVWIEKSA